MMASKTKQKKRPSMQDVADLAGVSRTTVSFVLNKVESANIPTDTQDRVLAAAKELNYRRNALASGLRSQKTHTIGFVSDVIASTPFAGRIVQGAQERAWEENYLLLLVNTGNNQAMKKTAVETLLDRQVDGIIYATMYHREVHPPASIREVPTVLLDCFVADHSLPSVVPDEIRGGYEATSYLIQQGHRKIAFICDAVEVPAHVGRLAGYKKALTEAEIPFDANLVAFDETTQQGGRDLAKKLFNRADRPTALFCYNDRMAMGAYDALNALNLSIPDDVAVIGFDDQDLIAADLDPGLTTMALPHYEMGSWAVNHLLELINRRHNGTEQASKPKQQILECPLIKRGSA
ncbi:MAG: LacI family DNA-binding transcriptional regulator [Ardenticatenaceae bacterium]|nr:LacI family DNA-binding transcriptional regulator [Ardenticatenaceae bacterium]